MKSMDCWPKLILNRWLPTRGEAQVALPSLCWCIVRASLHECCMHACIPYCIHGIPPLILWAVALWLSIYLNGNRSNSPYLIYLQHFKYKQRVDASLLIVWTLFNTRTQKSRATSYNIKIRRSDKLQINSSSKYLNVIHILIFIRGY